MAKTAPRRPASKAPVRKASPVAAKPKAAANKPAPKAAKKPAATKAKKGGSSGRGANATTSAMKPDNSRTVAIKQISNGFLLTESSFKNGKYREVHTYTPTKPTIQVAKAK